MFKTNDIAKQGIILNQIAAMLDKGEIISTLSEVIGPINSHNITLAHEKLLSGTTIGKLALTAMSN
jgi:NADPH2:quinone reductase